MKVAEVVEELLEVLRVVDLAHNLLYHTQNVHPVPATAENASRKSFNPGPPHLTTQGLFRPCECPFTLKGTVGGQRLLRFKVLGLLREGPGGRGFAAPSFLDVESQLELYGPIFEILGRINHLKKFNKFDL